MEANHARVVARSFQKWRLAHRALGFLREYAHLFVVTFWLLTAALLAILMGLWLDMDIGRGSLYHIISLRMPPPTPRQSATWTGWTLVTVAAPSLALAPLGPIALRSIGHVPRRGVFALAAGMLLTSLMAYGQQWHAAFCSPSGCSASGIGPLDAIGGLSLYRLAPSEIYAMHQPVVALLACFALAAVLLIGHDAVASRLLPDPVDDSQAAIESVMEAELNTWKVDGSTFGWHDMGVFDAVADTGKLQATGYRIFAATPRVTAKLPLVDPPEGADDVEHEPPFPRHYPSYDYTHALDQA